MVQVSSFIPLLLMASRLVRNIHSMSFAPPKNIVVIGGGIQGSSVAYFLSRHPSRPKVTVIESQSIASAASGKGGGFMARSWGDGGSTQQLHHLAFDLYEELAEELGVKTYRKLPVLSVQPGKGAAERAQKSRKMKRYMPDWLDGNIGGVSVLEDGGETAQVTPREFTEALISKSGAKVEYGTVTGVILSDDDAVTGISYTTKNEEQGEMNCDAIVVSAGPWSVCAEDWFPGVSFPMEGVKSTSIVFQNNDKVDATALFCGEDHRFGTHLEVYPRPDNSIYLCGIGGSEYISSEELKVGAYRGECLANPGRVQAASNSFREMSATYRSSCSGPDITQACMRPCPPDARPYMGQIAVYKGAYINAGHNCWGIAWAPACGKAMSELVMNGKSTCVDLSPFSPMRFTKKSNEGRGRKKKGTSVGEQW